MKFIAYFRVSTARQGRSGLGLEAQREAVRIWATANNAQQIAEYTEIETGKRADRPKLAEALAHCRAARATLVVAKLDRLARNVAFLSALMDSGAEFVACDQPHANRLTIHILAAVAEDEARRISQRTKDALAARRRRGLPLGAEIPACRNLSPAVTRRSLKLAHEGAHEAAETYYAEHIGPKMRDWRAAGLSLPKIAERLNAEGITTRRGKLWDAAGVLRVLRRWES